MEEETKPEKGDLVICLDTGSVGVVIASKTTGAYLISYPHGTFTFDREDFDVLKSGREG